MWQYFHLYVIKIIITKFADFTELLGSRSISFALYFLTLYVPISNSADVDFVFLPLVVNEINTS